MIDVHCHLNFHSFEKDYDEVIKRAFDAGVTRIINVGTKLDSSQHAVELSDKYEHLWAIVGVHPHHADKLQDDGTSLTHSKMNHVESLEGTADHLPADWIEKLKKIATHPKVIGIGECGMDYFSYKSNGIVDRDLQRDVFEAQIQLAHDLGLPLQIHQRQANKDTLEILTHHKNLLRNVPGMFHCFAGSFEFLHNVLDMGFYVGFDGNITYRGLAPGETTELKELANFTPLDRIVLETDSPFLTPIPHRGQRNEPSYVILVANYIAQLKGESLTTVVEQTTQNVYTIFDKLS